MSIYNLQLCILSIYSGDSRGKAYPITKNIYPPEYTKCDLISRCEGLFLSSEAGHSRGIKALRTDLFFESVAEAVGSV